MAFPTLSSPHTARPNETRRVMAEVLLALLPGIAALVWYFGWGVVINIALATAVAVAAEAGVLALRGRPALPAVSDLSTLVTAWLFAVSVPPTLPWWLTLVGVVFAVVVVKHLYGGMGQNPFNPAMAGYVLLLVSYPVQMTAWLPPLPLAEHPLTFSQSLAVIVQGAPPAGLAWDAITQATPLDVMRQKLGLSYTIGEIRQSPLWGDFGGRGWEWVGNWFLLGGVYLLWRRVITWHIPAAMLGALLFAAGVFWLVDPNTHPFPAFHLFTGGTILGAFFIATDPVTACTTPRGQLVYGAAIGLLVYAIRSWGGYPDAVAFSVLLLNLAAPTIDHYTRPRVFGHAGGGQRED